MIRTIALSLMLIGLTGCGGDLESKRGDTGEVCSFDGDCRSELVCIDEACTDPSQGSDDPNPEPEAQPPGTPGGPGNEPRPPGEPSDPPIEPAPEPSPAPDIDCNGDVDCPEGQRCFRQDNRQFCVFPCDQNNPCPDGTSCQSGACLP